MRPIVDQIGVARLRLVKCCDCKMRPMIPPGVGAALPAPGVNHGCAIARVGEAGRKHAEAAIKTFARLWRCINCTNMNPRSGGV
jgi:hypothetical protein